MSVLQTIVIPLITILISGVVAAGVSHYLNRRYTETAIKRDVLRRIVGNRYVLTSLDRARRSDGEPYIALNEAFVVYADHSMVISTLRKMLEEISMPDRSSDNIVSLVKVMANAAKVPIRELNDDFLTRPFTPPQ